MGQNGAPGLSGGGAPKTLMYLVLRGSENRESRKSGQKMARITFYYSFIIKFPERFKKIDIISLNKSLISGECPGGV